MRASHDGWHAYVSHFGSAFLAFLHLLAVPFVRFREWRVKRRLKRKRRRTDRLAAKLKRQVDAECSELRRENRNLDEKLQLTQASLRLAEAEKEAVWLIVARDRKRIESEISSYSKGIARARPPEESS